MSNTEIYTYDISAINDLPSDVSLRNIEKNTNNNYKIINYKHGQYSDEQIKEIGVFRSVIIRDDKVMCFSPPKSISYENFKQENSDYSAVVAEEYIEGTMVNLFFDDKKVPQEGAEFTSDNDKWELTTKSIIGADKPFHNGGIETSFRRMFLEAMVECGLEFNHLDRSLCYSFVVQHPMNRIVKIIMKPKLYLIAAYKIENSIVKEVRLENSDIYKFVDIPEKYQFKTYDEAQEKYASMETYYSVVGIIFKNSKGDRTKLRNPIYEKVKHLRGNDLKLQFHYMALRQIGKISNYLRFYPEHGEQFSKFRVDIHNYTRELHKNYFSCYIKKEKPLSEYPYEYKTNMFKLHEKYINELRPQNKNISMAVVINYVNSMHPAKLMYTINTPLHTQKRDIINKNLNKEKKEREEYSKKIEN